MNKEQFFLLLMALAALIFIGFGYITLKEKNQRDFLKTGVCFTDAKEREYSDSCVNLTLLKSPDERTRTLALEAGIKKGTGYLLEFSDEYTHTVTMKSVEFKHDLIWVDEKDEVVGFEESLPPCRIKPCSEYTPVKPAVYLIEVSDGFVGRHNINMDSKAVFG